ncbi:MAG: hypothetical protein H0T18_07755 [Chloroflexia bacterium]|nr:hypothetical protein [Chloroflexia bacterium]
MANSHYLTAGNGNDQVCVDATFEPDDAYWYDFWDVPLREFPIGETEQRAFCEEQGDTDWVLIRAQRGKIYTVETKDLAPGVDTRMVLYRGFEEKHWNGMDEFGANDDRAEGDPSSMITFTAPSTGSFLVGIAAANDAAGRDQTYSLSIAEFTGTTTEFGDISLSPNQAQRGVAFTASVGGLSPAETVDFWWERGGKADKLGTVTVDDNGNAVGSLIVPGNAVAGANQVEAFVAGQVIATATLTVVEPAAVAPPQSNNSKSKNSKSKKGKGKGGKKGGKGGGKK